MCIVIQSMAQQFEPSVRPDKAHSIELRRLLAEARAVRRARQSVESRVGGPSVIAAKTLDQVLSSAMPARIDVASYVSRVATLAQLSERTIGSLMTAITPEPMPSAWVRSLAVALVEMFHFVAVGVIEPDLLSLQLAVGRDGNRLIVGIAAIDRFSPVASAAATRGLLRAARIVGILGGSFQRGVDERRMVLGVIFETTEAGDRKGDPEGLQIGPF